LKVQERMELHSGLSSRRGRSEAKGHRRVRDRPVLLAVVEANVREEAEGNRDMVA
jgi:hypothetical protein